MSARRASWVAAAFVIFTVIVGALVAKALLEGGAATITPPTLRERTTLRLLNDQRAMRGLPALRYDPTLARLARDHTASMIAGDYFSHDEPGGRTYAERVGAVLRQPGRRELAENIALGSGPYGSSAALVNGWMHSAGHRANILNPSFHRTGLGVTVAPGSYQGYRGTTVATDEFSN